MITIRESIFIRYDGADSVERMELDIDSAAELHAVAELHRRQVCHAVTFELHQVDAFAVFAVISQKNVVTDCYHNALRYSIFSTPSGMYTVSAVLPSNADSLMIFTVLPPMIPGISTLTSSPL